ncbi:RHS repeat protein [Escherichia coli]
MTWYGWDGDRLTTVQTTPRVSRRYRAGELRRSCTSEQTTASREGSAAWRRSCSRKGARDRGAAWYFRLNWCGCWTGWRKKSGQTA